MPVCGRTAVVREYSELRGVVAAQLVQARLRAEKDEHKQALQVPALPLPPPTLSSAPPFPASVSFCVLFSFFFVLSCLFLVSFVCLSGKLFLVV